MKRVKSAEELNSLIAVREISCYFARIKYGLMLSQKPRIGEDGNSLSGSIESQIQGIGLNYGCTLMKTLIFIGIFINPN